MSRESIVYKYTCDRCGAEWKVTDPPDEEYLADVPSWDKHKHRIPQPWPFTLEWSDVGGVHKWDLCKECHTLLFNPKRDKEAT